MLFRAGALQSACKKCVFCVFDACIACVAAIPHLDRFLAHPGRSHKPSPLLVPLPGMFYTSGTSCKSRPASETTHQSAAPTSEDCFILLEKEFLMDTAAVHF